LSAFVDELHRRAGRLGARIALPESDEPRMIEAAIRLHRERLVRPVLMGRVADIERALESAGGTAEGIDVVEAGEGEAYETAVQAMQAYRRGQTLTREAIQAEAADPLTVAAVHVGLGRLDGGVAGAVHTTGDVLRAAIRWIGTAPGISVVSSSFFMVVRPFRGAGEEVLTFTDAGVLPAPTAEQLADIAMAAVEQRRRVVGDEPVVAFLSYSTRGSADGPEVRRVRDGLAAFRERMPDVPADGEFQADAALIEEVGQRKAPGSPVAGHANTLVFPDLDAGNIAYKLVQRLAGAQAIGPILQGLARPFNDLSRGASVDDIVNVACITALQGA